MKNRLKGLQAMNKCNLSSMIAHRSRSALGPRVSLCQKYSAAIPQLQKPPQAGTKWLGLAAKASAFLELAK
jgi:hypothetical protein